MKGFPVRPVPVESVAAANETASYFAGGQEGLHSPVLQAFFKHVSALPDVVRATIYAKDRSVLWSSTPAFIGQRLGPHPELEEAFAGGGYRLRGYRGWLRGSGIADGRRFLDWLPQWRIDGRRRRSCSNRNGPVPVPVKAPPRRRGRPARRPRRQACAWPGTSSSTFGRCAARCSFWCQAPCA